MLDLPALARGDAVLMQHTKLHNTFTCQPQQRNMHGRVFGGFLMRCSSQSQHPTARTRITRAWENACMYGHVRLHRVTIHMPVCRRAFELAFATCYIFAGSRPIFTQVGEITFKKPVEVGDLLRLHSTVLYTHEEPGTSRVSSQSHH